MITPLPHTPSAATTLRPKATATVGPSILKYHRLLRGWTQREVADKLYDLSCAAGHPEIGITTAQVSRWEVGKQLPGHFYRSLLCQLYGMTAQELELVAPPVTRQSQGTAAESTPVNIVVLYLRPEDTSRCHLLPLDNPSVLIGVVLRQLTSVSTRADFPLSDHS
jgi:transcriptional regulator with XRE-family HTH domain